MNRAQPPDQLTAVDADHLTRREMLLQGAHRCGIAIGLATVWAGAGLLSAFVFGVQSRSVAIYGAAALGLLILACAATAPVAVRAMRIDIRRGVVR